MSKGSAALLAALANRRSYYALRNKSPISDAKIQSILSSIMLKTPSAFNSQSTRTILLLNKEHEKLWNITKDVLLARIGPERFQQTGPRLDGFKAAYGTVLFYEDQPVISALKEKFPPYAENFESWSEHTSGMHQLMTWIALEEEGFGANLQHYNPVIDEKVAAAWDVPATWKLRAQLVFGVPEGERPAEKEKMPLEELMKVFGAEE
ncbi:Nitroreductase-like protein [Aspergillus leporis]|jgi:predicted oxidoreductase (fatty acid repression mutant protein)|uniref:Nitroreductase-like protein n=1 Tax=Aspergillus leporis TaxID=41062 RepID=A0A5N5WXI9_9EURO|nr:Nitroreductase-like protein [Aspergillus leporis]